MAEPLAPARPPAGAPVEAHRLGDDGTFPNHSRLPLLVLRSALTPPAPASGDQDDDLAAALEARFAAHGWRGAWRGHVFPFHHYHSTTHEVLGCFAGQASVRFGGPTERGITATLSAGDVVVIPAGVAHCRLGSSADFAVVGAYPDGRKWDLLRGEAGERPAADARIAAVPLPALDPVGGADGALARFWR